MFKKMYLGLIMVILFFASFVFAADESLTITTYYPSPYGVYKTLRLQPNDDQAAGGACTNEGDMAYDLSAHQALVCNGSTWGAFSASNKIRSGTINVTFTNGSAHSSDASVAFSPVCTNPKVFLQSVQSSVICGTGVGPGHCYNNTNSTSTDIVAAFSSVPTESGFSAHISTMDTVWVASSTDFPIHWLAVCDN